MMDGTGGWCAWWDVGKETEKTTQENLSPLAARPLRQGQREGSYPSLLDSPRRRSGFPVSCP